MPSVAHEALAQLFRNRPRLAPELLERALGVSLPVFADARVEDATFADLNPAEYRADLVITRWGFARASNAPACLLVIATNEDVAAWARKPINTGPANTFAPLIIGPASVPIVVSVEEAARDPELFVLSVMAHGRDNETTARAMLPAAARALRAVDIDHAVLYFDLIAESVGPAAARAFEELMDLENYEFQSDVFRRLIARRSAEGLAVGKAEGLAAGKAESVLLVLRARGLAVSHSAEARIRASKDLAELDRWIRLAVVIDASDALFTE